MTKVAQTSAKAQKMIADKEVIRISGLSAEQLEKEMKGKNSEKLPVENVNQKHGNWSPSYQVKREVINQRASKIANFVKQELKQNYPTLKTKDFRVVNSENVYELLEPYKSKVSPFIISFVAKMNEKVAKAIKECDSRLK